MLNFNSIFFIAIGLLSFSTVVLYFLYTSTLEKNRTLRNQIETYKVQIAQKEKEIDFYKEIDKKQLELIFENEKSIEILKNEYDTILNDINKLDDNESSEILKELMKKLGNVK